MNQHHTREELTEMLKALDVQEMNERQARLDSVTPVYQFSLVPASYQAFGDDIFDDAVTCYAVEGKIVNKAEMEEAGHSRLHEGSMKYLFNVLSGKFITSVGGGSTFTKSGFGPDAKEHQRRYMEALSRFAASNPDGGDITDLVNSFRQA